MATTTITVRDRAGGELARVTAAGADVAIEPPGAEAHPFVAAVVAQLRVSAARPRPRPSCVAEPPRAG
ncbi:MAG: hypothetical protein AB7V42_15145 [Thermoleophilia bacterium]